MQIENKENEEQDAVFRQSAGQEESVILPIHTLAKEEIIRNPLVDISHEGEDPDRSDQWSTVILTDTSAATPPARAHQEIWRPGDVWGNRFQIESIIGKGAYGQVLSVQDIITKRNFALKVTISKDKSAQTSVRNERKLLSDIWKLQTSLGDKPMKEESGANCIVQLRGAFYEYNYPCLVMDRFQCDLYDMIYRFNPFGMTISVTRRVVKQLCQALSFLSQSPLNIIHCDLKPENVMIADIFGPLIKVADFGLSCQFHRRTMTSYIQSRFYRAPEIILHLDYGYPIDMWSLGCIMAELHTGSRLFLGQNKFDQLLRIMEVTGIPTPWMLANGKRTDVYFDRLPTGIFQIKKQKDDRGHELLFMGPGRRPLDNIIETKIGSSNVRYQIGVHSKSDLAAFANLLCRMIEIDPTERVKPDDALKDPFFLAETSPTASNLSMASKSVWI